MNELLDSLESAIVQENWYAALMLALTLPDIAGHVNYPNDGSQKRYVKWFDKYIKHKYPTTDSVYYGIEGLLLGVSQPHTTKAFLITGEECYAIRCVILHEGRFKINGQSVLKRIKNDSLNIIDKVADCVRFTFKTNSSSSEDASIQYIAEQNILQINVKQFCVNIKAGFQAWLEDIEIQTDKQVRLKQSFRIFTYSN